MAQNCVILCFCAGFISFIVLVDATYVNPKIIIDPEAGSDQPIIINPGENYNLTCQGSQPLTWITPLVTDRAKKDWTTFETLHSTMPHNDGYSYRAVLHITNMSYPFVGNFTCQYEDNRDDRNQVYLYVNDPEHLSVEDNFNTVQYAIQYQETTIPCRPTSPHVTVDLVSYGTDEIESVYNPKSGYTFNVTDLTFEDTYACAYSLGDKTEEYFIFLKVNSPRAFLANPYIEDRSKNHTDAGQSLNLTCSLQESSRNINFYWKTPRGTFNATRKLVNGVIVEKSRSLRKDDKDYIMSTLVVHNTKPEDSGLYSCTVSDRQNHESTSEIYVTVHDTNDCFIEIREQNGESKIEAEAGQDVQWILEINAHPIPDLIWIDNKDTRVENDSKFHAEFLNSERPVFRINNVSLDNNGVHKVRGVSSRDYNTQRCPAQSTYEIQLEVFAKPDVCLGSLKRCKTRKNSGPKIYPENREVEIRCEAKGNPPPIITWEMRSCLTNECGFVPVMGNGAVNNPKFETLSYIKVNTTQEGAVKCIASNSYGDDETTLEYYVSDVNDGFDILNFGPEAVIQTTDDTNEVIVAVDDPLTFTCAVSSKVANEVEIFYNGTSLKENERLNTFVQSEAKSNKTRVFIQRAETGDSGVYSCRIRNLHTQSYDYRNVTVIVKDPQAPVILSSNLNSSIEIDYPKMPYSLSCEYFGIPKPSVDWYKDNSAIKPTNRIQLSNDSSVLEFISTDISDEGVYRCEISNRLGMDFREAPLKFKVKPVSVAIYYYITGAIGLLLLCAIVYIMIKRKKERELKRELKLLGLENFHTGNPENLNPELGIDDQAELLPYNKKWEFPVEHLKLGKQLGAGAFGVVMKAEAKGIVDGEERTTVAVKMVKKNADQSYIKALASELKIMVHLGKHINVVNLLGACTKNVAKRELFVIVEFCRFGNLQNYLFKHRGNFINQVDTKSGLIDYNIGADILERSYSVSSDNGNSVHYSPQDYRERDSAGVTSAATQLTSIGEESVTLSNNSVQPEWRLNYRGDYKGHVRPVSTKDLVAWSFQVARGMEYLASRKVLHGDLAARNILLADENIVKICDFGLAKTMYNDNNYKKKGNNPLPVKWMAIESIRDRVFSTQSDVWSYGIVLWELFSLARTPYPGMEADERLYYKLVEGYRMESPLYAPREIYKIMLDCWNAKPLARPSFTRLAEKIGDLLEDSVRKHYVDLNDPYLRMNIDKVEQNDYLAMLSPPSFDVLSTPPPHYVNAEVAACSPQSPSSGSMQSPEGYLFMGAKTIFSPRLQDENVFDFQSGRRNNSDSENEDRELHPMLHSNESDNETSGYLTPITPLNSISNPSYLLPPTVVPSDNPARNNQQVFSKTKDNYITMPEYKNLVNNRSSTCKQPGGGDSLKAVDIEKGTGNVHYVNSDLWDSVDV